MLAHLKRNIWISKGNHWNGTQTRTTVSTLTNFDGTTFIPAQLPRVHSSPEVAPKYKSSSTMSNLHSILNVRIILTFGKSKLLEAESLIFKLTSSNIPIQGILIAALSVLIKTFFKVCRRYCETTCSTT